MKTFRDALTRYMRRVLLFFLIIPSALHAADLPTLRVATTFNTPPFVMQGAGKKLFGYDIALMYHVCQSMNRTCSFRIVPFKDLLTSVERGEADMAVSSIIITAGRTQQVLFSTPYLPSETRFMALAGFENIPFSPAALTDKRIAIVEGSAFEEELLAMGVPDSRIIRFSRDDTVINALNNGDADLAMMDNPSALWWVSQTGGAIKALWKPIRYGGGLGIAVRPDRPDLLKAVNKAILQFENSPHFRKEYEKFLMRF